MKKINFINGVLIALIIFVSVIGIGGVIYQRVVLDQKETSTISNTKVDTTNIHTDMSNVIDNGNGTHTHTYIDENGETVKETHNDTDHLISEHNETE